MAHYVSADVLVEGDGTEHQVADIVSKGDLATSPLNIGTEGQTNIVRLQSADADRPDVTLATVSMPNSDAGEPNQVLTLGHNRAGSGGRQDNTRHSFHLGLEREFYDGAGRQAEYYLQYESADGEIVIRPFAANVDTATHKSFLGFRGAQSWTDSGGEAIGSVTESGRLELIGPSAALWIRPADATGPAQGALMVMGGPVTTRSNGVDLTYLQVTATPNIIVGAVSNACGLFLDTGAGQGITLRPNGGSTSIGVTAAAATFGMPVRLPIYTVSTLPPIGEGRLIYVSDETGGPVLAFSDGTNWRRVTDREIVS